MPAALRMRPADQRSNRLPRSPASPTRTLPYLPLHPYLLQELADLNPEAATGVLQPGTFLRLPVSALPCAAV